MSDKSPINEESQRKLDRKRQALRDNLKKRKSQIKDLSQAENGELQPRGRGFKAKTSE